MKIKIKLDNYNSTHGFVARNELEKQATECFGIDWTAEDDVSQIEVLLSHIGRNDLSVDIIDWMDENDIIVRERLYNFSEVKDIIVDFNGRKGYGEAYLDDKELNDWIDKNINN
tara:strand:- start:4659 stop:5000 length:342 start_codon:yes stop_codon:yes gene_type:complete